MDARQKQAATFAVKLVVTLVPAYFVYRNIVGAPDWDVNDLFRLFSMNSVRPFLLALLCLGVSNFSACLQWKLLLERQGVHMGYGHLLKLYYVGLFFNNFMPGNVGGDVKKVYDIRMQGIDESPTHLNRLFKYLLSSVSPLSSYLYSIFDVLIQ